MTSRQTCASKINHFCHICGEYNFDELKPVSDEVRDFYFKRPFKDQDKSWAPKGACYNCVRGLNAWKNGNKKQMSFGIPMVWREPQSHLDDCYFCCTKTFGFNKSNRKQIVYPNIRSVTRPQPHSDLIPVPPRPESPTSELSDTLCGSSSSFVIDKSDEPILMTQKILNDVV